MGILNMTNSDLILELLDNIFPNSYCDDCLSNELGIQPRQQVNQIGRRLESNGRIIRREEICSSCKKRKTTSIFSNLRPTKSISTSKDLHKSPTAYKASSNTIPANVQEFDLEHARNQIVRICRQIWDERKQDVPSHSISLLINTLKSDNLLPSHQENMMLTLCNLRNVYVYENMQIGDREIDIAKNALSIVQEWWSRQKK